MAAPNKEIKEGYDFLIEEFSPMFPGMFPKPAEIIDSKELDARQKRSLKHRARVANFAIADEVGNAKLDDVLTRIADGEYVFGDLTQTFDKNGIAFILLRWYEPIKPNPKKAKEAVDK